jgi:hypothetical protein
VRPALPPLCGCIWRRSSRSGPPDWLGRVQRRYLGPSRGNRLRGLVSAAWKRLVDLARHVAGSPFRKSRACSVESRKALERACVPGGRLGLETARRAEDYRPDPSRGVRVPVFSF